jgi:hypothetical protein
VSKYPAEAQPEGVNLLQRLPLSCPHLVERFFNKMKQCRRIGTTNSQPTTSPCFGLRQSGERTAAMGKRAREMLELHFTSRQAFERWWKVLENIA